MHAPDSVRGSVDGASFNLLTIKNQQSCRSNLARAHQPNQPTRRSQSCPSGERRGPHGPRALVSGNRARSIRLPSGPEAFQPPYYYLFVQLSPRKESCNPPCRRIKQKYIPCVSIQLTLSQYVNNKIKKGRQFERSRMSPPRPCHAVKARGAGESASAPSSELAAAASSISYSQLGTA